MQYDNYVSYWDAKYSHDEYIFYPMNPTPVLGHNNPFIIQW